MHSSRAAQPMRPRRFDTSRRTNTSVEPKPHGPGFRREDKNMNTLSTSSPRRPTKVPPESSRVKVGAQARVPAVQSRLGLLKHTSGPATKPKPKSVRAAAVSNVAPPPPPPLPVLDPNCNEPSLPCLCCDGRSPQDNNSMFNHNHNNNNTISIRHQLKLQPPPPPPPLRQEGSGVKAQAQPQASPAQPQPPDASSPPAALELEVQKVKESSNVDNKTEEEEEEEEGSVDVDIEVDVDEDDDEEEGVDDDDEDDDDTLVPSCCDCPPSLLDFSLSSSTSSSSTSISSCSDLELDCSDLSMSLSCSQTHSDLSIALSPQDHALARDPECYPSSSSPSTLPLQVSDPTSLCSASRSPPPLCSPDEGYPSAPASPSSDYLGIKGQAGHLGSGVTKLGLMDFLESMGEFGKMERFSQVIQVARWDLDGDPSGDLLRDRLDHLDRLEKVNRQVKLAHITRLHEKGLDLADLEEPDFSDVLDEMGNVDIPWKLYKRRSLGDSQEFSDAGVDLTAPSDTEETLASDTEETLASDSQTPSPAEPPPRPPKPPARHASVSSGLHTYINISREPSSICSSPSPILSTFSPTSPSPSFSTFRCEKPLPPSPPSIPPLPVSQPIPYFSLYM
ncbi:uncharacterized protein LOC124462815 [Hypomesus transpacificus]|uniref:uncharacterized protein LOC124462815 n=1 Tax=Hypomesus transpacificus TaxID=137520 RepID=UPI001F07FBEF|nr:uncharacterized protein LOC124462815 [Hypomesus transpacificus]